MRKGSVPAFFWATPILRAPFVALPKQLSVTSMAAGQATESQATTSQVMTTHSMASKSLGVVITGSTKGVGRALAEEFVKNNDSVIITSRTADLVDTTVSSLRRRYPSARVFGIAADVSKHSDVTRLTDFAAENLGVINAFICNAGTTGRRSLLRDANPEDMEAVVKTNLLGPMFCAKEVQRIVKQQDVPLHLFIMDGSGTRGNATANYAAYGATKRSVPQLVATLTKETEEPVRFHPLSPGMVLTDLLLAGNVDVVARNIFNLLAEEPETVAEEIVPKIRDVVINDRQKSYIQFLTVGKAVYRLATGFVLGFRRNKFFDSTGKRIDTSVNYNANDVRINEEYNAPIKKD